MTILRLLIFICISCSAQYIYPQTFIGCRNGGLIYRTPPAFLYGWTNPIPENCPLNAGSTVQHAQFIKNQPSPNSCPVGLLSLGGSGTLVEYRIFFCPLDKWLHFLLFPLAFSAYLVMKRMPYASK